MTKLKDNISAEEHKRLEEERARPFRLDIVELEQDCVSIKSPIILTKDQYDLIQRMCDISGEQIQEYIKDAVLKMVEIDLDSPPCFGKLVCDNLKRVWDEVKPK